MTGRPLARIARVLGIARATTYRERGPRASRYHRHEDALVYQQLKSVLRERGSYGHWEACSASLATRTQPSCSTSCAGGRGLRRPASPARSPNVSWSPTRTDAIAAQLQDRRRSRPASAWRVRARARCREQPSPSAKNLAGVSPSAARPRAAEHCWRSRGHGPHRA